MANGEFGVGRTVAAWGVHLLTASSVPAGMMALVETVRGDVVVAFWWMAYTLLIDSVDGTLARAVEVRRVIPWVDGSRLDDVVDYFTYVVVPAMFVIWMGLVPSALALPVTTLVVLASGYGFSQTAAKTADHFFTGFPSYWNVVVFYLYVLGWPLWLNAAVLTLLAIGVFVPIRYVYPSRTPTLRWLTITLASLWGAAVIWIFLTLDAPPRWLVLTSLVFPAYYVLFSFYLHLTTPKARSS